MYADFFMSFVLQVVISTIGLLFIGRLLEPIWGSREFLKFIFVVNFFTNVCVFITVIFVYYITMEEIYIYMPLSGFCGALLGLLVGVKEIIPDQELSLLQIKVKVSNIHDDDDDHEEIVVIYLSFLWVPYIVIFLSIGLSLFMVEPATCLPILIFSTYIGWIYLRYFQRKQETKITGDTSDQFSFSTFFPEFST
ncbi:putative Rhomboid-like superfamily protein [Helianthus annuus]|nr:putative Rhomboid-like superfamily protein [Helianthus annuus]